MSARWTALGLAALMAAGTAGCEAPPGARASAAGPGAPRDLALLVVEESGDTMKVVSVGRVAAAAIGEVRRAAPRAPTHRWVLRGVEGSAVAEGAVTSRRTRHLPPDPRVGQPAVVAEVDRHAFIVRAPWPAAGEWIEIAAWESPGRRVDWDGSRAAPARVTP